ncbi:MAG: efflux RND transporter periplasmic adaptor subunit [Acidobacteria bacterium]|nr:efflux RND transporter periplasmic adaptor subunit [Acidobacteriota bacterium]
MKKIGFLLLLVILVLIGFAVFNRDTGESAQDPQTGRRAQGRGMQRMPMTVELAQVARQSLSQRMMVVGNLIGETTVDAVPKISGRLQQVYVRLGDRIDQGQPIARIEDREIREQVKQAEASLEVAEATLRQREADLKHAESNLMRFRNLHAAQLISKQVLDEAEARFQVASAQLDLARAQITQARSRLEELQINLNNTVITSPVSGFVARRELDPGAWVTPNSSFISVVDINPVRLVANIVEKDLRRLARGLTAEVEVDAYPGEKFLGRVTRVSPVLDPATRTAPIEVEVSNNDLRLKPGMYARVHFVVERRDQTLVVPAMALVTQDGVRGVFIAENAATARFHPVQIGLEQGQHVEILSGLKEGDQVITTGASALRDGATINVSRPSDPVQTETEPRFPGGRPETLPPGTNAGAPPRRPNTR